MPQPLLKVNPLARINLGNSGDSPSLHRPKLALAAMHALANWSIIEAFWSRLFVDLLGSNPGPGAAIYASLSGSAAQKASFRAVAEASLSDDHYDLFEGLLSMHGTLAKDRAKLAHWVWGHSPDLPDCVLLCDQSVVIESHAMPADTRRALIRQNVFVYYEHDFASLANRIHRFGGLVFRLANIIQKLPSPQISQMLQELLGEPQILNVANRRRKDRKLAPLAAGQAPQQAEPQDPQG